MIGNLGRDAPSFDGQTLRTKLMLRELEKRADARVIAVDTAWLVRRPIHVLFAIVRAFRQSDMALIMPGERGLLVLLPLYQWLARRCRCSIHYLVVGGWLPDLLKRNTRLCRNLEQIDGIHVQSQRILADLSALNLHNTYFLSNFRDFHASQLPDISASDVLSVVFLSRIIPEKGVEHCIEAVSRINSQQERALVELDLWGPIPEKFQMWFSKLLDRHVPGVRYRGCLNPLLVVGKLREYDAMIFPTWYRGEGFPGVVIDAYAAGIPVIASDWHDNQEFVKHEQTGLIIETGNIDQLVSALDILLNEPNALTKMKSAAAKAAGDYHVDVVIPPLLERLGVPQKSASES